MKNIGVKEFGASLVSLGLGLGSGEFILWPLLTVTYGYGILWGALLGISIQLLLILEIQRYTSVKGEDFVSGVHRIHRYIPILLLLFSVVGFGWPGFTASASELFIDIFPTFIGYQDILPIGFLFLSAFVLLVGKNVYSKLEPIQSGIVAFSFILIIYLVASLVEYSDITSIGKGLIGLGNGYLFFPKDLDMATFLGAIAYAGTGGILILSQSFYTIEERHGMTKYFPRLSLWESKQEKHVEVTPSQSDQSLKNYLRLRRFQVFENTTLFWFLGLITIVTLSFLALKLLDGVEILPNSLNFLRLESHVIGSMWGVNMGKAFLMIGFLALLSVQIGIYDITGRVAVNVFRRFNFIKQPTNSQIYVFTILVQLFLGTIILLLGFNEPVWLLVTGAVINALCMAFVAVLTVILNTKFIPSAYQPRKYINYLLVLSALLYTTLFIMNMF